MLQSKGQVVDRTKIEEILKSQNLCRIALCDGQEPYIVPMNYGYRDGALYLHCAAAGRKVDIIDRNNLVCFEVEADVTPPPVRYKSVVGIGRAHILRDADAIDEALDILCSHFAEKHWDWRKTCNQELRARTTALRIDILEMTGKQHRYDDWAGSGHAH